MKEVLYLAWRYLAYNRGKTVVLVASIMLIVYLPLALRRMYRQRWRWTVLKAVLLFFIYGQILKLVLTGASLLVLSALS